MPNSINVQMLEERLELLKKELQQLLKMQVVYEGAIQECTYWVNNLNKEQQDK